MQILPQDYDIGTALGQGLNLLAQHKLTELLENKKRQKVAQGFKTYYPQLSEEQAMSFAAFPPEVQKIILERGLEFPQGKDSVIPQAEQQVSPDQESSMNKFLEYVNQQSPSLPGLGLLQQAQPVSESVKVTEQPGKPEKETIKEGFKLGLTPKEKMEREKLNLQKEAAIEKRFGNVKDLRKEVFKDAQEARTSLRDLNRLEELTKEGNLDTPGYLEFLKRSGLDYETLKNPDTQEFAKIQQGFLKSAKQYFGARVSNFEVEQFLKTIPNLMQSPEGRLRVIENLKYLDQARLERTQAYKEILKENKGIPPYDLYEQLDDRLEKKLDKLAERFTKNVKKDIPAAQNKLVTALQAAAGQAVGNIPKALLGAGTGAATGSRLGSVGGIPGAVIGGTLGGLYGLAGGGLPKVSIG